MDFVNICSKDSISYDELIKQVKEAFPNICDDTVREVKYEHNACLLFGNNDRNILLISNLDSDDDYVVAWVSIDKSVYRELFSDGYRVNLLRVFSSRYPKLSDDVYVKANLKHRGDIELNEKTSQSIAKWTIDTSSGKFYKRRNNVVTFEWILGLYNSGHLDFSGISSGLRLSSMAPNRHRMNKLYNKGKEYSVHTRRVTIYDSFGNESQTSINAARLVYCAAAHKTLDDIKDYEVDHIQGSLDDSASNLQLVTGSVNKLLQHYRRIFCNA